MRRNMQEVLERWGRWAASEEYCSQVDWPAMSVSPHRARHSGKPVCTDEDGRVIDRCVSKLKESRDREAIMILGLRFVGGLPLRNIASALGMTVNQVRTSLCASEAFLTGCLTVLGTRLDMDPEVAA
ncbi:hypothetical protein ETR_17032 [Erwinia tracheiphila PSU-1]|nr:hypothetical protein ETR_17032 [Erwinia tracheiphila PSU-1]